jgi:hypothetical protein
VTSQQADPLGYLAALIQREGAAAKRRHTEDRNAQTQRRRAFS